MKSQNSKPSKTQDKRSHWWISRRSTPSYPGNKVSSALLHWRRIDIIALEIVSELVSPHLWLQFADTSHKTFSCIDSVIGHVKTLLGCSLQNHKYHHHVTDISRAAERRAIEYVQIISCVLRSSVIRGEFKFCTHDINLFNSEYSTK